MDSGQPTSGQTTPYHPNNFSLVIGNIALVADDDAYMRMLVKNGLKEVSKVVEVMDGLSVVQKYKDIRPNMVFLDIHMPGKNGDEILDELLAFDPEAYVVMISGDSVEQNVVGTRHKGAKGFICKPFSKNTLLKHFNSCPSVVVKEAKN